MLLRFRPRLVEASKLPSWLNDASGWYYSRIDWRPRDLVSVFAAADGQKVVDDEPGTTVLHLEPRFRSVRLLDAEHRERGIIRAEGLVPGRFVLRRDGNPVWVLRVRSFVRKRHRLELVGTDAWMFDTPFFWWQHLRGSVSGFPTLLGHVRKEKRREDLGDRSDFENRVSIDLAWIALGEVAIGNEAATTRFDKAHDNTRRLLL